MLCFRSLRNFPDALRQRCVSRSPYSNELANNTEHSGTGSASDGILCRINRRRIADAMLAIEDRELAKAFQIIRDYACEGIQGTDVLAQTKHSPSSLEHCVKALFRSLMTKITRVRLDSATLLMRETDLKISQIASRTGFHEDEYFCEVFRSVEGMTPATVRKKFQVLCGSRFAKSHIRTPPPRLVSSMSSKRALTGLGGNEQAHYCPRGNSRFISCLRL